MINRIENENHGFYTIERALEPEDQPQLFPPALYLDQDRIGIFVAQWLVIVLYIAILGAAILLWQRRKHRIIQATTDLLRRKDT